MGAVTKQERVMIVTELMPGGSLQDLLTGPKQRLLSCFRATQMAADMARALFYLHRRSPKVSVQCDA